MRFRRVTRIMTAWIGTLALLMAMLVPSILHASGTKDSASWIEACSSSGANWVQADSPSDKAPASDDVHPFEHCPYCSLHANAITIPAATVVLVPVPTLSDQVPTTFLAAPRTRHAWMSAQPRAPPQYS